MGGRKGRNGLFPATACIKINGFYGESYYYTYMRFLINKNSQIYFR